MYQVYLCIEYGDAFGYLRIHIPRFSNFSKNKIFRIPVRYIADTSDTGNSPF
jgi:hypothetical protein